MPGTIKDAPLWVVSFAGLQPYRPMWELQQRLWRQRWAGKVPDTLLLLEHEPVVTLGKNAHRENLLVAETALRARGLDLVEVDRGGDVTYHGPGQLIGYFIFDLRERHQDVHRYLREIEETLIRLLARYKITAGRSQGATGVWVEGAIREEKIAAMGMHLSHWVSTHGFALNMNTDLSPFTWIIPCGLAGRGVTSMHLLLGSPVERAEVEDRLVEEVATIFGRKATSFRPHELADILLALERGAAPFSGRALDRRPSTEPGNTACPA
jgi:lipoyl(octanoyl) transferase